MIVVVMDGGPVLLRLLAGAAALVSLLLQSRGLNVAENLLPRKQRERTSRWGPGFLIRLRVFRRPYRASNIELRMADNSSRGQCQAGSIMSMLVPLRE